MCFMEFLTHLLGCLTLADMYNLAILYSERNCDLCIFTFLDPFVGWHFGQSSCTYCHVPSLTSSILTWPSVGRWLAAYILIYETFSINCWRSSTDWHYCQSVGGLLRTHSSTKPFSINCRRLPTGWHDGQSGGGLLRTLSSTKPFSILCRRSSTGWHDDQSVRGLLRTLSST